MSEIPKKKMFCGSCLKKPLFFLYDYKCTNPFYINMQIKKKRNKHFAQRFNEKEGHSHEIMIAPVTPHPPTQDKSAGTLNILCNTPDIKS